MRALLSLIRGFDTKFTDFELAVLDKLSESLDQNRRNRLQTRLSKIARVYRLDGGREVNMYDKTNNDPANSNESRLVLQDGEFKLAKFKIESSSSMTKMSGSIFLVNGNLFSISFDKPTEHAEVWEIASIEMKLANISSHG